MAGHRTRVGGALRQKFLIGAQVTSLTFLQTNMIVGTTNGFRALNPVKGTVSGQPWCCRPLSGFAPAWATGAQHGWPFRSMAVASRGGRRHSAQSADLGNRPESVCTPSRRRRVPAVLQRCADARHSIDCTQSCAAAGGRSAPVRGLIATLQPDVSTVDAGEVNPACAVFIDKAGQSSRKWSLEWVGQPTSFGTVRAGVSACIAAFGAPAGLIPSARAPVVTP